MMPTCSRRPAARSGATWPEGCSSSCSPNRSSPPGPAGLVEVIGSDPELTMNRIWQTILGIERSPGAVSGGDSWLEFATMPRGAGIVVLVVGAVVLLALMWRLYRLERR